MVTYMDGLGTLIHVICVEEKLSVNQLYHLNEKKQQYISMLKWKECILSRA